MYPPFDWWYYGDPSLAYESISKQQRKEERKAHRNKVGCRGCARHSIEIGCTAAQKPHSNGFCKWWWDARTGKRVPEIVHAEPNDT